ncbi:tyrosine-type recombinase/integrase [Daejeonella sp.]|jgi:integrase|uniref:tyrosine-type recombinase/integrase n=1 Tax=Daejeonella sp. TaxID=2805397 RepID=UPI0037C0267C
MYTEPKIFSSEDLKKRTYILFYLNGKRIRIYNGNLLDKDIHPNRAINLNDRSKSLNELLFELKTALRNNTFKLELDIPQHVERSYMTEEIFTIALNNKLDTDISLEYKRNLKYIHSDLMNFLTPAEKQAEVHQLKVSRIEAFLSKYNSSGTYYMNKRRDLSVMFSAVSKLLQQPLPLVKNTSTRKTKSKLHKIYETEQLKAVLAYLKAHHQHLYLCCLITYGCFLRPHKEVRNLTSGHFKKNITEIHLSGSENKGKKVRVVYIPDYVRNELALLLPSLKATDNIFSKNVNAYNEAYFNTAWTRCWKKMFKLGIVQKNHTVYSFRHTAAVNVYNRSKDVNLLKSLLGHSSILVTLKYLRGLGEYNEEIFKDAAPRLEF